MPFAREAIVTYLPTEHSFPFTKLTSPERCFKVLKSRIGRNITESVIVMSLDSRMRLIGYHEVARGSTSFVNVEYADIFRYPIIVGASNIVLAHNHPSGDIEPSEDDETMTRELVELGSKLGIKVLDHIIVTADHYYSWSDEGKM